MVDLRCGWDRTRLCFIRRKKRIAPAWQYSLGGPIDLYIRHCDCVSKHWSAVLLMYVLTSRVSFRAGAKRVDRNRRFTN